MLCFYPAWAYVIPSAILKLPMSFLQSLIWTSITYFTMGYTPEEYPCSDSWPPSSRILILLWQVLASYSFYTGYSAGFIIPLPSWPGWMKWLFWVSPMSYAEIAVSGNEFLSPRWQQMLTMRTTIGQATLESRGLNFGECFFWIAIAALFGFAIVYNIGFTFALCFLKRRMMVLPFEPLTLTFQDVQYYIDTPLEMRKKGYTQRKLQLISNVTGALRPGILTALMGTSGAGKTTLLDVLVEESLIFSASLRLASHIDSKTKVEFVKEVLEIMELNDVKDALAGIPCLSGLSTAQRKRLTIAVELVANPSVIFMDEPTTSLDARAAAIVMRAVKNVADTGRTIICTIHQTSIDIFEAFDELILPKNGGSLIYFGPLGQNSCKVIEYFVSVSGVPKIKDNCNPATWMLEVTFSFAEDELGADFAEIYKKSALHENNQQKLFNVFGSMYAAVLFLGMNSSSSVQPFVATERVFMYRERFAGMYSSWAYALAQVTIEVPYLFIQALMFEVITYPMIGYYASAYKVLWYFYIVFCTQLYFTFFGMLFVSLTPEVTIARALLSAFYPLLNLFTGFLIPQRANTIIESLLRWKVNT
ncbi:hypothetical protein Goari_001440 [Gossypium aridum]|uniref:ABC transporter domain-containing protein n=1 Tax=Gossypium aridum TaxID=34290 RepID=A0A7J8YJU5_GOSAI|nr:hypothetical protein [Gossypium aridum]